MLSVLLFAHSLRFLVPGAVMMGSSPVFFSIWGLIRMLTAVLPHHMYRTADDNLYAMYQRMVLFFFFTCNDVKVYMYGDVDKAFRKKENVIYICNHQTTVDWMIANLVALKQGSLPCVRYVMKDGLKYFPLYGCYWKQHGCIFVKRSGNFSVQQMEKQVKRIKDRKEPVWMVIFPEGTRFNPELKASIKRSRQYAVQQGYMEFDYVISPKIKAFQVCIENLRGHVDAVYDITIGYSHTTDPTSGERLPAPSMPDYLMKKSPELHLNLERIDIADIPADDKALQSWIFAQFRKKERLLSHFYSKGSEFSFPGSGDLIHITMKETALSTLFFTTCLTVILSHPQGRSIYWKTWLACTVGGCVWMAFRSQA